MDFAKNATHKSWTSGSDFLDAMATDSQAPRITSIKVKPEQVRVIIGAGGKTIKGIVDQTGVQIDVEDDGTVNVASADEAAVQRAIDIINGLIAAVSLIG